MDQLKDLFEIRKELIEKRLKIETDIETIDGAINSIIEEEFDKPAEIEEVFNEMDRHLEYMRKFFNK